MNNEAAQQSKGLENIDIKNWVTKSNILIEGTYKLSLQEQRILLVLASKVQPSDDILKTYRFRAKDFIEIIGNKAGTGFYSYLKEIVNGLQTKVLTIKKDGKQRNYNWVITSIYEENEAYITLQFHPELKDFFLELKEKFTSYQLENVVRLNSVYSIRIYELLKQYEKIQKRHLSLMELRYYLGIEQDKYKQYGHFKSKVILVAQKEINSKTDIQFEFNELKTGRKVTSIEFVIKGQKKIMDKQRSLSDDLDSDNRSLKSKLISLGVSKDKCNWLINEFNEEQILRNIEYVHSRKKGIKHLGAYTIKAIQMDYGQVKPIRTEIVPDYMEKEPEANTLEDKQAMYFKKRGSQEEFEDMVLQTKELEVMMNKLKELDMDMHTIHQVEKSAMKRSLEKDITRRKELDLELQSIEEYINQEIKEVYIELLNEMKQPL